MFLGYNTKEYMLFSEKEGGTYMTIDRRVSSIEASFKIENIYWGKRQYFT